MNSKQQKLEQTIFRVRVIFATLFAVLIVVAIATGGISINRESERWSADDERWIDNE